MNPINVLTLLTILLYGSTPFAQTAQTPEEVYGDAIKSLNAGDCRSALLHLEKYQAMAAAKLQSHPEFKGQIDAQRQICLKHLADAGKLTPGIYGEKPNVRGIRGMDNEASKTIELRPR